MSGLHVPLRDLYAAIAGAPPGIEVGAMCDRLDLYLRNQPMGTASLMIIIALLPVDRFTSAIGAAERQLASARLAFGCRETEALSTEQHVIARMADALAKVHQENEQLHRSLNVQNHRRWRSRMKGITITVAFAVAVLIGRYTA